MIENPKTIILNKIETLNILVVDDETGMRLAIERALTDYQVRFPYIQEKVGFKVFQAATGEQAMEMIETSTPDILLLDHKLPGLSGLDILGCLAKSNHHILTVMITAYASFETAVTSVKLGAYDFLAKPFTPDELKSAVYKAAKHIMLQRQAERTTEEKRKLRFEMISIVSHELKAPLSAVESYLNIIHERRIGSKLEQYDNIIERCLARMQGMRKLIVDLLDLTRIESGQMKRELVEVDLWNILDCVIENNLPLAEELSISIETKGIKPLKMTAEKKEIEIILDNLISNAIKYNYPHGKVEVALEQKKENVVITVSDTGIGMTKKETDLVFEDFYRARNEKTQNILGSGLGLAIIKRIAELYRGSVNVNSQPDRGSVFTVKLPIANV